jgi:hypothetical protein
MGRHQTRGDYIILRFAHDIAGGPDFMYGPVVHVPSPEMEQNGLGIVLGHNRIP